MFLQSFVISSLMHLSITNLPRRLDLVIVEDHVVVFPHFTREFPELQYSLVTPDITLVIVLHKSWVQ
jgi:hypothetical protein